MGVVVLFSAPVMRIQVERGSRYATATERHACASTQDQMQHDAKNAKHGTRPTKGTKLTGSNFDKAVWHLLGSLLEAMNEWWTYTLRLYLRLACQTFAP